MLHVGLKSWGQENFSAEPARIRYDTINVLFT